METVLSAVSAAPNKNPLRMFLYGQEGVGKTTWAARIPGALFLSCEDGSGDMEIPTIKIDTWAQLLETVDGLIQSGVGAYRAVVLDTVSSFERLCWEHLLVESKDSSIESAGFGKSYTMAAEEVARLLVKLSQLRERRQVHIVLLGHALFRAFNDPNGPSYDLWQPAMHEKASALYMRWADVLLFAAFEATVKVAKRNKEKEATATEKGKATAVSRVLYTTRDAAYLAKNRYGLPEELPLSWDAFAKAIRWQQRERAFHPLHSLQDAFTDRVRQAVPDATAEQIAKAENTLLKGKSFAAFTVPTMRTVKAKIEEMSADDFWKQIAPAFEVAAGAAAAAAAAPAPAAPTPNEAELAEAEQHAAYTAVKAAFIARCKATNGEDPGTQVDTAELEPKLGGPWAGNSAAQNKALIESWEKMPNQAFIDLISPFITTFGF